MGLAGFFRRQPVSPPGASVQAGTKARRVLNVGGGNKQIPIPECYGEWDHVLLDIDPTGNPDIVCDAREMYRLEAEQFDAVYCSHNLEHYYKHDRGAVLAGFLRVLKPAGFADIAVPDVMEVMKRVVESAMDIDDVLYQSPSGPITVRDVIYGHQAQIERTGVDFYAHKDGFSARSLQAALNEAGFGEVFVFTVQGAYELRAIGFKNHATDAHWKLLGLPSS